MQKGSVYRNGTFVGSISKENNIYTFSYDENYLISDEVKKISINFPLQKEPFISNTLFAFFSNMLTEGVAKDIQCRDLRIDKDDDFSRLLKSTKKDNIGSIEIREDEVQNG